MLETLDRTGRGLWRARVSATPDRPFLIDGSGSWSYAEADEWMRRVAAGLRAHGIGPGDRVLVGMENSAAGVIAHLAVRELGAVLVTLLPGLKLEELAFQVEHSEAPLMICDGRVAAELAGQLDHFPHLVEIISGTDLAGLAEHQPCKPGGELPGFTDRSPADLMYTSGSTARPKAVLLPAGCLYSSGWGYAERFRISAEDRFLLPLTIGHGVGGIVAPGMVLHAGAALVLVDRFSPGNFWRQVREYQATCTLLFPAQLNILALVAEREPPETTEPLRLVISQCWSAPFQERFGIETSPVWASTECGSVGAGTGPGEAGERSEGFVGRPFDNAEIGIFEPGGARRLPAGEVGEIRNRHPHVMLEYLKDPEQTAATLDPDGWIRTGDLGLIDPEGRLWFRGRIKNMVKRSGENISPAEVEGLLLEHPAVAECLVFGVDDPLRTQELAAAVVLRSGARVDEAGLERHVHERAAPWKAPRYLETLQQHLPRLASGKVDRGRVISSFDPARYWDRERRR